MNRDECHAFWRDRVKPDGYLRASLERSEALVEVVRKMGLQDPSILELGCNCGRNLAALWRAGYHRLSGVEISSLAVYTMWEAYPYLEADIRTAAIEDVIQTLVPHDIIFTMATLLHLHPVSEWCFAEMVRLTTRALITIEAETRVPHGTRHHFQRNYREVFEPLGMRQIAEMEGFPGLGRYTARVFVPGAAR